MGWRMVGGRVVRGLGELKGALGIWGEVWRVPRKEGSS